MRADARAIALVTGASSGIGAGLARELARDGHDLVLVARRLEPMNRLAEDLRVIGARATVIAADLSQAHAAVGLADEIRTRSLAIDVLINAAGLGANGRFDQSAPPRIEQMLQVNIVALTELTRLVVPGMVARRRGKIMLVASTAAFQPGPQMAVYCASKAYVLSLGEAIAYELRDTGVTVTTLCPGPTATEFAATANAADAALFKNPFISPMSAAEVARIGYRGLKAGRRVVITGRINHIMAISGRLSPPSMTMPVSSWLMTQSRGRDECGAERKRQNEQTNCYRGLWSRGALAGFVAFGARRRSENRAAASARRAAGECDLLPCEPAGGERGAGRSGRPRDGCLHDRCSP